MRLIVKILLPLLVIAGAVFIAYETVAKRSPPTRRAAPPVIPEVEVRTLSRERYQVSVETRGTVRPRTESSLIPEVAGRIVKMSVHLRAGGFFEADEILVTIDPRDYQAEVTIAKANLAQAEGTLAEEQARASQAGRDWTRLGERGKPDPLVLRKPQLAGARAGVSSATARLALARTKLERTQIRAPYAGRVLEQNVDVGQYVSPGTALARIYAVDYVEVRLPLTDRQLTYLQVPERYRGDDDPTGRLPVLLSAEVGRQVYTWNGRVVRAEGSVDARSRQLFVVAQVDDPYGKGPDGRPPLKIGQFVRASIQGDILDNVFVIPRASVRPGNEVLVLTEEGRIARRTVKPVWNDRANAVIDQGLTEGERLITTPLGGGMDGTKVRILGQAPAPGSKAGSGGRTRTDAMGRPKGVGPKGVQQGAVQGEGPERASVAKPNPSRGRGASSLVTPPPPAEDARSPRAAPSGAAPAEPAATDHGS